MPKELQSTDITTITSVPELLQLVEEVQRSQQPHLLKRQDEQVALIVPVTPTKAAPKRKRRTGILTEDDPLFRMIGIGNSGIPGGVSGKKHEYLARAYRVHSD